jgi:hypothetical protein
MAQLVPVINVGMRNTRCEKGDCRLKIGLRPLAQIEDLGGKTVECCCLLIVQLLCIIVDLEKVISSRRGGCTIKVSGSLIEDALNIVLLDKLDLSGLRVIDRHSKVVMHRPAVHRERFVLTISITEGLRNHIQH